MGMHQFWGHSGSFNLSAATAKTFGQLITPSTRRAFLLEVFASFPSVTAADAPVLLELLDNTNAGTSSSFTPLAVDEADPAALCSFLNAFTVEPTGTTQLAPPPFTITPIGSLLVYRWEFGQEYKRLISKRTGFRLTSPAAQTGCRAGVLWQE